MDMRQSLKKFTATTLAESATQAIRMLVAMATQPTSTISQVPLHQEGAKTRATTELIDKGSTLQQHRGRRGRGRGGGGWS